MHSTAPPNDLDSAAMEPPLVDVHAHVYHLGMPMQSSAWHQPIRDATVEEYVSTLDQAGVRYGVLAAASMYGDYNDYMLDALRAYDRLRATVIVDPEIDPYILRMMKDDGIVGIRLQFRNVETPPDLSSYSYQKLLRRVADLDWHVHLHDEGDRLPQHISHIEMAGPRLVIDHFGRPAAEGGINSIGFQAVIGALERGRTWVKLSGAFRLKRPELARELAQTLLRNGGPERLLWGSDWPFAAFEDRITYADTLSQYRENVPDAATRRAIDETALQFYFEQTAGLAKKVPEHD
jgi:predicted TIM-barrel fold metal-dependent hydrolase